MVCYVVQYLFARFVLRPHYAGGGAGATCVVFVYILTSMPKRCLHFEPEWYWNVRGVVDDFWCKTNKQAYPLKCWMEYMSMFFGANYLELERDVFFQQ